MPLFPSVKRIAVLRANALGDLVFALPALLALKTAYPSAEVVYFGASWHSQFLDSHPGMVDKTVVIPQYPGVLREKGKEVSRSAIKSFFTWATQRHYDIAVQLHGGGRYSNGFIRRLKPKFSLGCVTPDAPSLDYSVPYFYYQSEVCRNLEVVALAGAVTDSAFPSLRSTLQDRRQAKVVIGPISSKIAVIAPAVGDIHRRWPSKYFASLADHLSQKGYAIFFTGTEPEKNIIRSILRLMSQPATDLSGMLSLNQLVGLLSLADLVVANDTGPLHLAVALNRFTIGIFSPFTAINSLPLNRRNFIPIISWDQHCPLCSSVCSRADLDSPSSSCGHQTTFLSNLRPQTVIDLVNRFSPIIAQSPV